MSGFIIKESIEAHNKWQYTYFDNKKQGIYFIENFLDPMTVMGELVGITKHEGW